MRLLHTLAIVLMVALPSGAALVPTSVPGVNTGPWGAWVTEKAGSGSDYGAETPLALDSKDVPHIATSIACSTCNTYSLVYLSRTLAGWTQETVSPASLQTDHRVRALAIDSHDVPHILASDYPGAAYWTRQPNGSWTKEMIDTSSDPAYSSLKFDSAGRAVAVWPSFETGQLILATRSVAGAWGETPIVQLGSMSKTTLAFGHDGLPRIMGCCLAGDDTAFYLRELADGSFVTESIGEFCIFGGFALDPADQPHYACDDNNGVYWSRSSTGAWTREIIFAGNTFAYSLAVDSRGNPSVTFEYPLGPFGGQGDPIEGPSVAYASKLNGQWYFERPARTTMFALDPELVLDSQGRPHVAYTQIEAIAGIDPAGYEGDSTQWYTTPLLASAPISSPL